jgi:hypothetical protein
MIEDSDETPGTIVRQPMINRGARKHQHERTAVHSTAPAAKTIGLRGHESEQPAGSNQAQDEANREDSTVSKVLRAQGIMRLGHAAERRARIKNCNRSPSDSTKWK